MKLIPFRDKGLYGLADLSGAVIIGPKFIHAGESIDNLIVATIADDVQILINATTLEESTLSGWDSDRSEFSYGLLAVCTLHDENSLYGYIDGQGKLKIPLQFAVATSFDRTGAKVKVGRTDSIERRINRDGQIVGQPFLTIRPFHPEGLYCGARIAWGDAGMVIVNGSSERIGYCVFDEVWQEHEGLIPVVFERGVVGWVDTKGSDVCKFENKAIGNHFESGLVPVQVASEKWGLMNLDGRWVVDPEFDIVESVGPNRFMLGHRNEREDTSVKLADGCGNFFGDHLFESINRFQDGVARVWRISKIHKDRDNESEFNYIDMDGKLLLANWS